MAAMSDTADRRARAIREGLSPREQQLLEFATQGLTDNAIANRLGISLATVGTYWGRVRIKFGPFNRTELVAMYLKEEATQSLEALRRENEELVEQVRNQASESQIHAERDLFRGLIETAPDAILLVNQHGTIELANEAARDLFGYTKNELIGKAIEVLIPERYHQQHPERRAEYMENPVKRRMGEHLATFALRKDGTEFPIAAALSAAETPGGTLVTCIVRDLSQRES